MRYTAVLCACAMGGLLGFGAIDKLMHWPLFVFTLEHNPLLPASLAGAVGGAVVAVECLVAGALLVPRTRRRGFFAAACLFAVFTAVIGALLFAAPGERCGCTFMFGYDRAEPRHLLMNVLLTALSGFVWHAESSVPSPS